MRFCQILTFTPAEHLVPLARHAEAVGFDSVAFSDHVVYPLGFTTNYPYSADGMPAYTPDSPWLDPLVAIAACAAATERLRFITNVYVLGYRHPISVAKQVASADFLSGGPAAVVPYLSATSPHRRATPEETALEIELRTGPKSGADARFRTITT